MKSRFLKVYLSDFIRLTVFGASGALSPSVDCSLIMKSGIIIVSDSGSTISATVRTLMLLSIALTTT